MSYVNRHLIHQINQSARLIAKKANEQLEHSAFIHLNGQFYIVCVRSDQ